VLLDDIADLLTTGGITTTIYKGRLQDRPNDAIALLETGGQPAIHAMSTGPGNALFERPSVQILRRSTSYNTARAEMNTIHNLLDGVTQRTINSTRYSMIQAVQPPFAIDRDSADRAMLSCNFLCMKTLSTG
jgi:hypothetical protein